MSSGASPFARSGTPRAPSNYLTQQLNYNLQNYATSKLLGPGKNPVRPLQWSHVQSMGRYGAPSLTNKLYTIDRAPLLGQGPNSPPDPALVGHSNLLAYQVQINFTIIYSRRNNSKNIAKKHFTI